MFAPADRQQATWFVEELIVFIDAVVLERMGEQVDRSGDSPFAELVGSEGSGARGRSLLYDKKAKREPTCLDASQNIIPGRRFVGQWAMSFKLQSIVNLRKQATTPVIVVLASVGLVLLIPLAMVMHPLYWWEIPRFATQKGSMLDGQTDIFVARHVVKNQPTLTINLFLDQAKALEDEMEIQIKASFELHKQKRMVPLPVVYPPIIPERITERIVLHDSSQQATQQKLQEVEQLASKRRQTIMMQRKRESLKVAAPADTVRGQPSAAASGSSTSTTTSNTLHPNSATSPVSPRTDPPPPPPPTIVLPGLQNSGGHRSLDDEGMMHGPGRRFTTFFVATAMGIEEEDETNIYNSKAISQYFFEDTQETDPKDLEFLEKLSLK